MCSIVLAVSVALSREHTKPVLLLRLGDHHRATKEYRQAIYLYKQLAAVRPQWAVPHLRLGWIYVAQGRWDEADTEFSQAWSRGGTSAEALVGLGVVAQQLGDVAGAIDHWRAAATVNPRNVEAHYRLAQVYVERSDFGLAREELKRALLHDKHHQGAHYYLGLLLATDEPEAAIEHLRLASRGPDVQLGESADSWVQLLDELALASDDVSVNAGLAQAYLEYGLPSLAVSPLERVLTVQPDNHTARAYLGYALLPLGHDDESREILRHLTQVAPKHPLAYYFLGLLHRSKGYLPTALWELKRALRLDPLNAATYATIGDIYQRSGQYLTAAKWYESAADVAPQELDFALLLAQFYVDVLPRAEEAVTAAQQAAALAPDNPMAQEVVGWAHYLNGDLLAARAALEKAVQLDPELARAHYHLGVVYSALGEEERARTSYERAIDLDSDGLYRRRALADLQITD